MCVQNEITQFISIAYLILCIGLPILYLVAYACHKAKKKYWSKAFVIAIIIFLVLFSVKIIAKVNKCSDCYINNKCEKVIDKDDDTTTTTTKKTTTTESTTTSTTTTTKKVIASSYDKVAEISGEKVSKGQTSKGFDIYEIDGVTYIDGYMIVNKTYTVGSDFVPTDTKNPKVSATSTSQCADCINNTAWKAWNQMKADAAAVGINLWIASGYRSYVTQNNIYNRYVARDGQEKADTYSARPGSSEHQTGLCFDINSPSSSFNGTKEAKWIDQNAYKYGYIIRYPDGKMDETGYKYESWHVRYVGTDLSYILYNDGDWISMENYFGITSKYQDLN